MADQIRPTRATRRVLLALLTGDPDLDGRKTGHLAGICPARTYLTLHRLERYGWVTGQWMLMADGKPERRLYALTRQGRARAAVLLGLRMSDD